MRRLLFLVVALTVWAKSSRFIIGSVDSISVHSGTFTVLLEPGVQVPDELAVFAPDNRIILTFRPGPPEVRRDGTVVSGSYQGKLRFAAGYRVGYNKVAKPEIALPDERPFKRPLLPARLSPRDPVPMVLIEAGDFEFGTDVYGHLSYTTPVQKEKTEIMKVTGKKRVSYLFLPAFHIDQFEVTNTRFAVFLDQTGTPYPYPVIRDQRPADRVSFALAESYCKWAGKRLPSELEWEKAARGAFVFRPRENGSLEPELTDTFRYPTGHKFDPLRCVTAETAMSGPRPVSELTDASPFGVYGMCGNAAEWTSSYLLPYRGNTTKHPDFGRRYKVIRGGSWRHQKEEARVYHRRAGGNPSLAQDYAAGFRCARDI